MQKISESEGYGSTTPLPGTGKEEPQQSSCGRKHSRATLCPWTCTPNWSSSFQVLTWVNEGSSFSYNFLFLEFLIFISIVVMRIYFPEFSQVGYRDSSCSEMSHTWEWPTHVYMKFWCHDPFPKVCRHILFVFWNYYDRGQVWGKPDSYLFLGNLSVSLLGLFFTFNLIIFLGYV